MRQPDIIDCLLRENLINWALEDIHDSLKRATLEHMSQPNWLQFLYSEEPTNKIESPSYTPTRIERLKEKISLIQLNALTKPLSPRSETDEFVEEEWVQDLLKGIYYALKQKYQSHFETKNWGMRRINTTGMYALGPINDSGEIFFRFRVGIKNRIVYWDLENRHGKIRPKGFEEVPKITLDVVKAQGYDFLIRKISKAFGVMHYSGESSKQALSLLLSMKGSNIGIGSDAHGNMYLQAVKKKRFRLVLGIGEYGVRWLICDKTTTKLLGYFSTEEDVNRCIEMLNLTEICPQK